MKNAKPITDLELYELLVAAYPEKFDDSDGENDLWDEVMDFADEKFIEVEALCELLGRVAYLAAPLNSAISDEPRHTLGTMKVTDGKIHMRSVVSRRAELEKQQ